MRLQIYPFDCETSKKRCRKKSKNIKENRKEGAARMLCESTADQKRKALHLFRKKQKKWDTQNENVRKKDIMVKYPHPKTKK